MADVEIKTATASDRQAIIALLMEMHADVGMFPLSMDKVEANVDDVLANGLVLLATEADKVVGSIGLYLGAFWYSEERVLMDCWIFASPRATDRLSVFRHLIKAVSNVAVERGLQVVLTLFCERDENRKASLFARYGEMVLKGFHFQPVGGDFKVQ